MQEYGKVPVDVKQCDTGVEKDGTVTMFEGNIQYQPLDFPIDVKRFAKACKMAKAMCDLNAPSPWGLEHKRPLTESELKILMEKGKNNVERDCDNCIHRKEDGCEKWECEFEPKATDAATRVLEKIAGLSHHDKERLAQCIVCAEDPFRCGITEEDEDENGMCLRFKRRMKWIETRL